MKKNFIIMAFMAVAALVMCSACSDDKDSSKETAPDASQAETDVSHAKADASPNKPSPAETYVETDPNWIYFKGGTFEMGYEGAERNPPRTVTVAPFELAKAPVTVEEFYRCIGDGPCKGETIEVGAPSKDQSSAMSDEDMATYQFKLCFLRQYGYTQEGDQKPINCISSENAKRYANWVRK